MPECNTACPLKTQDAATAEMHPACFPCDSYRGAGKREDMRHVARETLVFTSVSAGLLSLIVMGQGVVL
jgi:hypothetical protein